MIVVLHIFPHVAVDILQFVFRIQCHLVVFVLYVLPHVVAVDILQSSPSAL